MPGTRRARTAAGRRGRACPGPAASAASAATRCTSCAELTGTTTGSPPAPSASSSASPASRPATTQPEALVSSRRGPALARDQQPSQLALASHLGIDRTVMTYVIDELEEAGLVERRPNPDDRRQRRIVATPRGREAVSALCQRATEAENAVLAALDPAERAAVRRLLSKAAFGPGMAEVTDPCEVAVLDA